MRDAVTEESLNQYTPDLIEPLRDEAAAQFGRARDERFEVVGTEGAQAGLALALLASVDPGDEVIVSDPGYFHIPSAVLAAGATPVAVAIRPDTGFRLDPAAVAAAITPRTRAICIVDPVNPYGTVQTAAELEALAELAERHRLLLIHDVTHAPLAIGTRDPFFSLPALDLTDNAVAVMSVSHCFGMAGARIGFLGGPPGLVRGCLQLKAALTRLNTNLISQHGALAALRDRDYLQSAAAHDRGKPGPPRADPRGRGRRAAGGPPAPRPGLRGRCLGYRRQCAGADGVAVRPAGGRVSGRWARGHRRRQHDPPQPVAARRLGDGPPARGASRRRAGGGLGALARSGARAAAAQGNAARRDARAGDPAATVSVAALTEEFGSPLWLADVDRFAGNVRAFAAAWRRHWPATRVAYSYKTNRLPAFLQAADEAGALAEVAGAAEYELRGRRGGDRPGEHRG